MSGYMKSSSSKRRDDAQKLGERKASSLTQGRVG
jgi:hypothetical protein